MGLSTGRVTLMEEDVTTNQAKKEGQPIQMTLAFALLEDPLV